MEKCLLCEKFPFCGNEKETCIDFKKRGIEYEKLKKKTEQKEKENFPGSSMNMDIVQEGDNNSLE